MYVLVSLLGDEVYDFRASRDGRFITLLYKKQVTGIRSITPEEAQAQTELYTGGTLPVEASLEETHTLFFIAILDITNLKVHYDDQIGNECKPLF